MTRLGILMVAALFLSAFASQASAYCVYNRSDKHIVAFQMPITSRSFKKVIKPNKSACCNWSNWDCNSQTFIGPANRYGFTPLVVGSYSSYSKANSKKNEIQVGAVFQDIFKTGLVAYSAYKGCVKCAKKAILLVEEMSQQIFKAAYTCSGLMQNGAGVSVDNGERCNSWDLIPKGTYFFPRPEYSGSKTKKSKRLLSAEPPTYKMHGVPWPKVNDDAFAWLPWIR